MSSSNRTAMTKACIPETEEANTQSVTNGVQTSSILAIAASSARNKINDEDFGGNVSCRSTNSTDGDDGPDSSDDVRQRGEYLQCNSNKEGAQNEGVSSTTAGLTPGGASGEILADALSSCLATIAANGGADDATAQNLAVARSSTTGKMKVLKTKVGERVEEVEGGSGSMSSSSSSNGSALTQAGEGSSGSRPAMVTATATTSEGDDRESSLSGGNRSGGTAVALAETSGDDPGSSGDGKPRAIETSKTDPSGVTMRHHHYHHRTTRKHPPPSSSYASTPGAQTGDGYGMYGLPVPMNDQLRRAEGGSEHTTVVAHLPPPSTDASSGSGGECEKAINQDNSQEQRQGESGSLLQPRREPGFHTIRRTFNKFARRGDGQKLSETDSSNDQPAPHKYKKVGRRQQKPAASLAPKERVPKKRIGSTGASDRGSDDDVGGNGGSSSGSGTEGGYAGSASSNENVAQAGCSSPSVSSSEDSIPKHKRHKGAQKISGDPNRPMLSKKQESSLSVSSEIADFSSGTSEGEGASDGYTFNAFRDTASESPSITSSSNGDGSSDDQDESYPDKKVSWKVLKSVQGAKTDSRKRQAPGWPPVSLQVPTGEAEESKPRAVIRGKTEKSLIEGKPPILALGCDVMAHVLTFLEPPDILSVLTMPLSKDWLNTFTRQAELWRVLCLLEPFKARVNGDAEDSSDESLDSFPVNMESDLKYRFGKFRILYTSFVRCLRYLARIKDDAIHGRPPSVIDYATSDVASGGHNIAANQNLHQFLARARGVLARGNDQPSTSSNGVAGAGGAGGAAAQAVVEQVASAAHVGISDDGSSASGCRKRRRSKDQRSSKKRKVRYGTSQITRRLLGPSAAGNVGHTDLPWSCAIYSIVNWMVAFSDVEGIQTMCLKVLPFLLEDEQQRITAQRAGLTDIVLRGMVMFPESSQLHTASFHTIVLLARPLGGREGMLFHTSMVNSSGIFSSTSTSGSPNGKNGIAVMLDSMRRFRRDEVLQAMSCWSLVNIALVPAQKEVLVQLGGIEATANAMLEHPYNAEVQFRALFALINLVIPSVSLSPADQDQEPQVSNEGSTEREMLDEMVDQIIHLVVLAMKNFCSSEAILNRACLVLHNVSLTQAYHGALLWTPNCYQMLEWCLANYRTDQVLQQSAAGTLHRLQMTLSSDDALRARFSSSLQTQQQLSLERAHREAMVLHEQQQEQQQQINSRQAGEN